MSIRRSESHTVHCPAASHPEPQTKTDVNCLRIVHVLPGLGLDHFTAMWAIDENLPRHPNVSAIIVADSYTFRKGAWYFNDHAHFPLDLSEREFFSAILKLNSMLERFDRW